MGVPTFPAPPGGGSGGTITTALPISGDGSVGSPATIANGVITNAKLATPPQDASAVVITGGTISGTGITLTPALYPSGRLAVVGATGVLSTVDTWEMNAVAAARAYSASLTGFAYMKFGQYPLGAAGGSLPALKGSAEGGGSSGAAGGLFYSVPIFQTPKTGPWFIRFAGNCRTNAAAVTDWFAIGDPTLADYVTVGISNGISATNYVSQMSHATVTTNNTGSLASNTAEHNFDMKFDGTTFKCDVDGANIISTATLTNFPTLASAIFLISAASTFNAASVLYAYVDPRVLT